MVFNFGGFNKKNNLNKEYIKTLAYNLYNDEKIHHEVLTYIFNQLTVNALEAFNSNTSFSNVTLYYSDNTQYLNTEDHSDNAFMFGVLINRDTKTIIPVVNVMRKDYAENDLSALIQSYQMNGIDCVKINFEGNAILYHLNQLAINIGAPSQPIINTAIDKSIPVESLLSEYLNLDIMNIWMAMNYIQPAGMGVVYQTLVNGMFVKVNNFNKTFISNSTGFTYNFDIRDNIIIEPGEEIYKIVKNDHSFSNY